MTAQLVFILDDNDEFRESTAFLLDAMGYQVEHFGVYEKLFAAIDVLPEEQPVCLLLDIRMPQLSGLDVHDLMHEQYIDIPVIYMTAHGDVPLAVSAMRKGALTFLEKPLDDDELQGALNQALSAEVQGRRCTVAERAAVDETRKMMETLTPRELDVTRCIVNELSNKEIAAELNISIKTVELHRSRAMQKLQAKNAAQLIRRVLACESGLSA
ncbi:MAG: response regulator transcription factor [Granulosicoccus sp.]